MNWPAYPEYKDSGVEWLGDVPCGWQTPPLQRLFRVVGGSTPKSDVPEFWDGDVRWITPADLGKSNSLFVTDSARKITNAGLQSCATEVFPAGTVVVAVRAPIGTLGIASVPLATNQGCKGLVGEFANSRFVAYQLSVQVAVLNSLGRGSTFTELSATDLGAFRIAAPPLEEQECIADFLDREVAKIDALIDKQDQLIATLREDRTATIAHAVTKGLNPDVEMKDSGASWIGAIPNHWAIGKVKHGFTVTLGKMYQTERQRVDDELLPHLKAGSVRPGGALDLEDPMLCWFSSAERKSLDLRADDLLVVEGGATYGRCTIISTDLPRWGFQKSLNRVRSKGSDSIHFLSYLIQVATDLGHVSILCGKATIPHFTAEKLESLDWPRPPVDEQLRIVQHLDAASAQIDELIAKSAEVIDILGVNRSALITAAVTGKIDVRKAA